MFFHPTTGSAETIAPLTAERVITQWELVPTLTAALAVAAVAYLTGVFVVRRRHPSRPWPWWRTLAFFAGLATLAFATESGLAAYDDLLFWVHMWQHLLLLMVVPPLLLLGQPMTLLVHASRNPVHRWLLRVMRSPVVSVLTFPLVGFAAYTVTVVVTHLTDFMNVVLTDPFVHDLEHVWYLAAGYLYFLPLIGREPIRWRLTFPTQLFFLFLAMPVDTFTGVVLLQTNYEPFPAYIGRRTWGPTPLDDLHAGGAIMWIAGDAIMLVVMVALCVVVISGRRGIEVGRWLESLRAERFAALAGGGSGESMSTASRARRVTADDDEQLAAYNAYLARLHERSEEEP